MLSPDTLAGNALCPAAQLCVRPPLCLPTSCERPGCPAPLGGRWEHLCKTNYSLFTAKVWKLSQSTSGSQLLEVCFIPSVKGGDSYEVGSVQRSAKVPRGRSPAALPHRAALSERPFCLTPTIISLPGCPASFPDRAKRLIAAN